MGLFDFLGKKKPGANEASSDREVSRFERIVGNKLSQNIDRQEAIEALSKMGTRASAAAHNDGKRSLRCARRQRPERFRGGIFWKCIALRLVVHC